VALALLSLTSAFAFSLTLHKFKKMMPAKETAIAAAAGDPELPSRFVHGSFQNSRSQSLFTVNLPPKDTTAPPKAMLVLAHGVSEHCCRNGYINLYQSLSEAGVDVYSFDHHGHGRSDGEPRGYTENFDHYVSDLLGYVQQSQNKYTEKNDASPPLILMGQSMGALISVRAALQLGSNHVGGLIITSPALGVDMNLELKIQKLFAPVIDMLMPKSNIVDAVRPVDMSRNPKAVQAYIDDPLCTKGKLVARTAIQMSKSMDIASMSRLEITCPVLLLHGTDDRCTSIKASRDFFENISTPVTNKLFLQLPGMYHELLEDPEVDKIIASIVEFASTGGKHFAEMEGEEKDGVVNVVFKE